ncbi:hypothetical protein EG329_005167 [Mollisiaceae sp. DMI_Dod_QoI]|nr:hypothetical protein EG329_005167 [Helotiales sp. DMI_Dod_QoI]
MPPAFNSYELKELVIEWALRNDPGEFTLYDLPKSSLEDMAMLDTNGLNANMICSTLFAGADLALTLERDERNEHRINFLRTIIGEAIKDPAVRKEVKEQLDVEIKLHNLTHAKGPDVDFAKKAQAIANARVLSKLPGDEKFILQPQSKFDYEVILNTLRDGHGGQMNPVYLFMEFKNSLWYFLSTLQDATQLSTIPPLYLASQYCDEEQIDFSKSTSSHTSELSSISSGSLASPKAPSETTLTAEASLDELSKSAHRSDGVEARGYTLDHGPWLYRIVSGRGTSEKKSKRWHNITGVQSFEKMIKSLQEQSQNGEKDLTVAVVHSLDKAAIDRWNKIKAEGNRAEREFEERLREQGFSNEDIGEPFMKWLEKDLIRQSKEGLSQPNL